MPKPPTQADRDLADRLNQRAEFEAGFKRSKKGNLWCNWQGMTLTIFGRDDGCFAWCIVDAEGEKRFSRGTSYEDEESAIGGLADQLEDR